MAEKFSYEDIINLPHHVSPTRPQMPIADRAAQFSPFAALTGYHDAVKETARWTDSRVELDESEKSVLNDRLLALAARCSERPEVTVTYFQPDAKKAGGAYVTAAGKLMKLDEYARTVVLTDGRRIPIDEIIGIEETAPGETAE